jgi:hypothetical protein
MGKAGAWNIFVLRFEKARLGVSMIMVDRKGKSRLWHPSRFKYYRSRQWRGSSAHVPEHQYAAKNPTNEEFSGIR